MEPRDHRTRSKWWAQCSQTPWNSKLWCGQCFGPCEWSVASWHAAIWPYGLLGYGGSKIKDDWPRAVEKLPSNRWVWMIEDKRRSVDEGFELWWQPVFVNSLVGYNRKQVEKWHGFVNTSFWCGKRLVDATSVRYPYTKYVHRQNHVVSLSIPHGQNVEHIGMT